MPESAQRTAVAVIEATEPVSLDLESAPRWHVILTVDGTPRARVEFPSPGDDADGVLTAALTARHADHARWREGLRAEVLQRLGATGLPAEQRHSVSVVVCTHRRPQHLPVLLEALQRLSPPPAEIVVVDNDPGTQDCKAEVGAAGARYVREDRRGADNARNAGLAAARGDIVAFADDDCVPCPDWLQAIDENFADPLVAVTTGPGFPYALDTAAQRRIERQAGFDRGLVRRSHDWRTLPVVAASAAGVSANMAARRSVLTAVRSAWPPELGPGTPTESGDDTYVLSRVLAAGHRIVYDPRQWFQHRHREDPAALHRAVVGYGKGATATLAKSLVEDAEWEAPLGVVWLLRQYRRTQLMRLAGRADAVETRIAWNYVRGALAGPTAWRASRRQQRLEGFVPRGLRLPPPTPELAGPDAVVPALPRASVTGLSVLVAAPKGGERLDRCLDAILACGAGEVVVAGQPPEIHVEDARVRHVAGGGAWGELWNAAAAIASGHRLLCLTEDNVVAGSVLAAHQAGDRDTVIAGHLAHLPASADLATSWWTLAIADGPALAPPVPMANVSVPAALHDRLGGFGRDLSMTALSDFADRAIRHGACLRRADGAVAAMVHRARTVDLLKDVAPAWRYALTPVLAACERLGLRRPWQLLLRRASSRPSGPLAGAVLDLAPGGQLQRDPEAAAFLRLHLGDEALAALSLRDLDTSETLVERILAEVDRVPDGWQRLARAYGWAVPEPAPVCQPPTVVASDSLGGTDELRAAGADVTLVDAGASFWSSVAAVAQEARTEWIAVPLPGTVVGTDWLRQVSVACAGSRIGVVVGAVSSEAGPEPLHLASDTDWRILRGGPIDYVAIRRSLAAAIGGAARSRRGAGPVRLPPLLAAHHAAASGWLIARRDTRGTPDGASDRWRDHRIAVTTSLVLQARSRPSRRTVARVAATGIATARRRAGIRSYAVGILTGLRLDPGLFDAPKPDGFPSAVAAA